MLSFKPKTNKTIEYSYKQNMTLDQKHQDIIETIHCDEKTIPSLKNQISILKTQLKQNHLTFNQHLSLNDKLKSAKTRIKKIKSKRKQYYLDNSEHIFRYFEDKKNITCITPSVNKSPIINTSHSDKISTFFNMSSQSNINAIKKDSSTTNEPYNEAFKTPHSDYIYEYMKNMDDIYFDIDKYIHPNNMCQVCTKGELIPVSCDGVIICNKCGIQQPFITDHEKPSYKEPPKEVCFYAYKRINHFREILAQFQAKESTQLPPDVLDNIQFQIKKERIQLKELTYSRTKLILKNLGYNKYYEHIPYIKNKLGIRPPIMSPELENTLCNLFTEIQHPYSKYCPDDRTNFLNYYYTVFKLCELLDQTDYLTLLKEAMIGDRIKRIEQDVIWKKICGEMDWEFIATE